MVLEANINVLNSLTSYYERLSQNPQFPSNTIGTVSSCTCRDHVVELASQLRDMINDAEIQASRAKLLSRITGDRKAMVR